VAGFFAAEDIVDVEDIIAVLIVISIVFNSLAGFGQYSSGVPRRLVVEPRVANAIGCGEVGGKRLKRLGGVSRVSRSYCETREECGPLTLMKPPSGLARRYAGCTFIRG
jgi:hypothetical protein